MTAPGESPYDAILVVSFGGPEKNEDVIPFLENVLCGKNVPRSRMLEVAEHYYQFGGASPINAQNRALVEALDAELAAHKLRLPIYLGNRNWHPLLRDTLRQMRDDGVRSAVGFFTSAYSSYSSCRQYRENVAQAQSEVGPDAPKVDKLRVFFNHPGFIEPNIERVQAAFAAIPPERHSAARLVFTAHSIPAAMADNCRYVEQLNEASRLVAARFSGLRARLVFQSRSGPPSQAWLEPDILDHLRELASQGVRDVVVVPIGFISDHLEIAFDLDTQAQELSRELGMNMVRAATVGTHPKFIAMVRELIEERLDPTRPRRALGSLGVSHDVCPADCCLPPRRPSKDNGPSQQGNSPGAASA